MSRFVPSVRSARRVLAAGAATALTALPLVAGAQETRTVTFDNICSDGPTIACASVRITTRSGVQVFGQEYDGLGTEVEVSMQNHQGNTASADNLIWSRLRDFRMYTADTFGSFVGFGTSTTPSPSTSGDVPTYTASAFAPVSDWHGEPVFGNTTGGWMTGIIDLHDFFDGVGRNAYYTDVVGCSRSPSVGTYTSALQTCVRSEQDVLDGYATAPNNPWVTVSWQMSGLFNADDAGMSYEWKIFGLPGISMQSVVVDEPAGPTPGVMVDFSAVQVAARGGFGAMDVSPGFVVQTSITNVANADGFNTPGITAAVPEPGSIALLATGLLALGGVAVRRRR